MRTPHTSQSGFTLVELMVSLSLFIIVVLALVGSLYTVNDASKRVQAMRTVMDNLNFAMESMSRNIRTSEQIVCGSELSGTATSPDCPISQFSPDPADANTLISMHSTLGTRQVVEYRLMNGAIEKRNTPLVGDVVGIPDPNGWIAITSPEITVDAFSFYVEGARDSDLAQPSVIIKVEGVAAVANTSPVPFAIQTLLSQRTPEVIPGI